MMLEKQFGKQLDKQLPKIHSYINIIILEHQYGGHNQGNVIWSAIGG
jgi:hypothetical protein